MQLKNFPRNLLFFFFILYNLQGLLYASGSIISQACLLIIFVISGYYFALTLLTQYENNWFYYAWTLLLLLNILGFIFTANFSDGLSIPMFKDILGCMLTFYPFYYFAKRDVLKRNHLISFFIVMLPITILQFLVYRRQILLDSEFQHVVNNLAYSFVTLLPFLFLIKKKNLITGAIMALLLILIIQGAKRGAIVAGFVCFIMYFYYKMKTIESHNRIRSYIVIAFILIAVSIFAYETYISNEYLISRMASISEGNLSNREYIYKEIFYKWYNSESVWNSIFGYGFAASLRIAGNYAHNDWLELLSNFGLLGFSIYLILLCAAVKLSFNKDWTSEKKVLMLTITVMWFVISMVSMWYTSLGMFTQSILIGFILGSNSKSLE
jgi:hypothetical protein